MSDEKTVQAPEKEVTEPAQVLAEKPIVTEKKEIETPKNEAADTVSQSDWQQNQERLRTLENALAKEKLEKFEAQNPIVKTEKYSKQWEEVLKLKSTPGHRYSGLDHQELLNLIRDHSYQPEPKPKPTPVPSLNLSVSPSKQSGEINETVNDWLSMRYTKEEIAATKG